jgi:diguanylate cyclase (GGDEF)-like protein
MGPFAVHAAPETPTPGPAVVRPGPPPLPPEPDRWLPLRVFPWQDDLKPIATSLAIDAKGYLWAGTPQGPVRYNGRTWRAFEIPHTGPPVSVWPVVPARDGSLWFGTEDRGVLRWQDGKWRHFDHRTGITDNQVRMLAETIVEGHSVLWAGTIRGLSRCTENGCSPVEALSGLAVRAVLPAREANGRPALWVGTDRGLLRLKDIIAPQPIFASVLFNRRNGLADDSVRCLTETVSSDGSRSLWVGTDHGISRLHDGAWTRYEASSGFPDVGVTSLAWSRSPQGKVTLWAGTFRAGLARFDEDGSWRLFDAGSGLPANYIYALLQTGAEPETSSLWMATAAGIARLDSERWHGIDSRDGLPHDTVLGVGKAIFPDGEDSYWLGTLGGMVRLGKNGWRRYAPDPALEPMVAKQVLSTTEDDGSRGFWIATLTGLRHFAGGRWTLLDERSSPLPGSIMYTILAVPWQGRETLWAATTRGVARFAAGRWTVYRRDSGLPADAVSVLFSTPSRTGPPAVWAGTENGLARFTGEHWETVHIPCQPHPAVKTLALTTEPGGASWLWIGTMGGLARVRIESSALLPGTCEALTDKTEPTLKDPFVVQVQVDLQGRLYLFTNSLGVVRLTILPKHTLDTARIETFDRDDGLPGLFFNNSSFRDPLGRLWAGSMNGVAVLDPAAAPPPTEPSPLFLERVRVAGQDRAPASGWVLRHDQNSLEFEIALLSFHREHATRYRTQLVGLETRPTPWSQEAREIYTRLPPGEYTFRAWGKTADGTVAGPVEMSFRIRRAPWLTPWAVALYALVLMGLGYGVNLLRLRRVGRRTAELEALVAERTRELAEANRKLELASLTDPLTGLNNRRFVTLHIEPDLRLAERNYQSRQSGRRERNNDLLLYLLDIDRFKDLNDRVGHPGGDTVLAELARRLREVARASDSVVRWGGEEFLLISRWTDREAGEVLALRILEAVGDAPYTVAPGRTATVTCSLGWAPYPWRIEDPEGASFEQILSLADRALYLAKREGRDRAVGVRPGPVHELRLLEEGALEEMDGSTVELTRTVRRGSREIPRPSRAAV